MLGFDAARSEEVALRSSLNPGNVGPFVGWKPFLTSETNSIIITH